VTENTRSSKAEIRQARD